MLTPEFEEAIVNYSSLAENSRYRLHVRGARLVSVPPHAGVGLAGGARHTVLHIDGEGPPKPHRLTAEARLVGNQVVYGPETLFP